MNDQFVVVRLDKHDRRFQPGEELAGAVRLEGFEGQEIKAVEISVLWYTEGKGDEDLSAHYFERHARDEGKEFDAAKPHRFSAKLPNSPLSYRGVIVSVVWCVRVRVFLPRGKTTVHDEPFQLGAVPPGIKWEPPAPPVDPTSAAPSLPPEGERRLGGGDRRKNPRT